MPFITKLAVERAVAGGMQQRSEAGKVQFKREPAVFALENVYLKSRLPKYTGALMIAGNCAGTRPSP